MSTRRMNHDDFSIQSDGKTRTGEIHVILVLGSGTIPTSFPDARLVITANGAVHHLSKLPKTCSDIKAVVTDGLFEESSMMEPIRSVLFANATYKDLILTESYRGRIRNLFEPHKPFPSSSRFDINPLSRRITYLSFPNLLSLLVKQLGALTVAKHIISSRHQFDIVAAPFSFLKGPSYGWWFLSSHLVKSRLLRVSTGTLAVLIALELSKDEEVIQVLGITADRDSYAFGARVKRVGSGLPLGRENHLPADLYVLSKVISKNPGKIFICDDSLRAMVTGKKNLR